MREFIKPPDTISENEESQSNDFVSNSEQENYSQILDSTISSVSGFSGASHKDSESGSEMDRGSDESGRSGEHITLDMKNKPRRSVPELDLWR